MARILALAVGLSVAACSLQVLPVPIGSLSQEPDVPGVGGAGGGSFPCQPIPDAGVCTCTSTASGVAVVCFRSGDDASDAHVAE